MEEFKIYTGTTVPLMNNNIDTDQLMPKQFLKSIEKKGYAKYLMYDWRYLDDKMTENPEFVFNKPEYKKATWGLVDYGFRVVIAGSFSDIHYNNELNNGLLPIVQPLEVRKKLASLKPSDEVTIDLPNQKIISPVGEFSFDIDKQWKYKLVNGLDDISITLEHDGEITKYEEHRPSYWQS